MGGGQAESPVNRYFVEQRLDIVVPESLIDRLYWSDVTVLASGNYGGGAVEVQDAKRNVAGVLVYFPGATITGMMTPALPAALGELLDF